MEAISLTVDNNLAFSELFDWLEKVTPDLIKHSKRALSPAKQEWKQQPNAISPTCVFARFGCIISRALCSSCNFSRAFSPVACFPTLGTRYMLLFRFLIGSLHYLHSL